MSVLKVIGKTILRFATIIGFVVLALSVVGSISFYKILSHDGRSSRVLPDEFMLTYDLRKTLPTMPQEYSVLDAVFGKETLNLYDFLRALDRAKNDDRVAGLAVTLTDGDYSLTQLQDMRKAVLDFKESGKKTVLYTTAFGDFSNGMAEYWFASAFETIIVQPIGNVSLNGIYIEQPYGREALNKVGIEPQMIKRKAYKTGADNYLREGMSDEGKETLVAIAEGVMDVMVHDIATARDIEVAKVAAAIHESPLTAQDAENRKLIDMRASYDFVDHTQMHQNKIDLLDYAEGTLKPITEPAMVAYIPVEGMILSDEPQIRGAGPLSFVLPDKIAEATGIADRLMAAADEDEIKVILLYINSPGGSPTASETIRAAVSYARAKGKFVIAAMGDVAASGGYWIASNANQIIASNLTITGSIGVYGGKMNLEGLWNKIGVNWDSVQIGNNAGLYSMNAPYTDSERDRVEAMMDDIYDAFITRVAQGRRLSKKKVEDVAQGRVWMGNMARTKGLVDLNGGFDFVLKRAAAEAGGLNWQAMNFLNLQATKDPLEELMDMVGAPIQMKAGIEIPSAFWASIIPEAVVSAPAYQLSF